jgi:hypothetical protein
VVEGGSVWWLIAFLPFLWLGAVGGVRLYRFYE